MGKFTEQSSRLGREAARITFLKRKTSYNDNPCRGLWCQEPIPYNKRNSSKFCNHHCAGFYNNRERLRDRTTTNCIRGGKDIPGWQKFCSKDCSSRHINERYISSWLNGEHSGNQPGGEMSNFVRDYMLKSVNYKCPKCGWAEKHPKTGLSPLNIHHKDGDDSNNVITNLEVMCPNCHSLTETFGALNRRKSKKC